MASSDPAIDRGAGELRLGTRGSQLALWQAEHVRELLETSVPEIAIEIVPIKSSGELFPERNLAAIGVGVFTREIDGAVLDGRVDFGVHSLKDMPADIPDGLRIGSRLSSLSVFASKTITAPSSSQTETSAKRPYRSNSTWATVLPGAGRSVLTIFRDCLSMTCITSLFGPKKTSDQT